MTITLQLIEPFVNDIVAICFFYRWQPLMTGKSDEENSAVVWDCSFKLA
jgi:hypothetical protein